jgi:hypothetical protein
MMLHYLCLDGLVLIQIIMKTGKWAEAGELTTCASLVGSRIPLGCVCAG